MQTRLLSVVALFRSPVADETVLRLVRGLFGEGGGKPLPDDDVLAAELRKLQARGILSREPMEGGHGSACHPILRDHFRALLLGTGAATARRAADLLEGQPSDEEPRSLKEIEPVLLAIELLLDAGEFQAADELYRDRLANGEVFRWIPAVTAGLSCALGFVRDDTRRKQCEEKTSRRRLGFYLGQVGLFAMISGQYEPRSLPQQGNDLDREMQDAKSLSSGLQNKSELLVFLGRLADAKETAAEALQLASEKSDESEFDTATPIAAGRAVLGVKSRFTLPPRTSPLPTSWKRRTIPTLTNCSAFAASGGRNCFSAPVTRPWRAPHRGQSPHLPTNAWNHDIALCHWMLGWCALAEARLDDAQAELHKAEPILHRGQLLFDSPAFMSPPVKSPWRGKTLRTLSAAPARPSPWPLPRGMRLVHADALVVRGRARLLEAETDSAARAADDAEEALRLARDCGYAWAERDALFLQADAHAALAASQDAANPHAARRNRDLARRAQDDAQALAAKLRLTEEDLADAERKAKAWLAKWEADKQKDKEEE